MTAKTIGVFPVREHTARPRLFAALALTLPVRFRAWDGADAAGLDAVLVLDGPAPAGAGALPALTALGRERDVAPVPGLKEKAVIRGPLVALSDGRPLDARLRRSRLADQGVTQLAPLAAEPGDEVLAAVEGSPVWVRRGSSEGPRDLVTAAPDELEEGEALRDRLRNGRFLAVTAMVHFLRDVCRSLGWNDPPLRACFLFDDPNLHWLSYGHLRYRDLIDDARRHRYHVSFATVPLDAWFVHPSAGRLFREHAAELSLAVHGNNHARMELAHAESPAAAQATVAQALRRIQAFEQRSGVPVSRVMVAPHGVCSREVVRTLSRLNFDALCISRPYPWLARPPRAWLEHPVDASALVGWEPASVIEDGLPVLLRRGFQDPVEDLALRAFLNQALIIHGHHADVADGLDLLRELAATVNAFGEVDWCSLGDIAAGNVATRRDDASLHVRMFTRRTRVVVPEGLRELRVSLPFLQPGPRGLTLRCVPAGSGVATNGAAALSPGGEHAFALGGAGGRFDLSLSSTSATGAPADGGLPTPAWAVARRLMSEGRDRIEPAYRRVSTVQARALAPLARRRG
jgi:hypothetical protein